MKRIIFFLALSLSLSFCACNQDKELAQALLEQAQTQFENGNYAAAKTDVDSLKVLYPKQFEQQKAGLRLIRTIELNEQQRNLSYCDSLLKVREIEAEGMKKTFVFEKSDYDEQGKYIDKSQLVENNIGRSYLRSGVTEDGEMYLASIFYGGKALKHNQLKVSKPNGDFMQTQVIAADGGANYSFTDLGMTTEVVTYQKGRDAGAIAFIFNNASETLKVEYLGGQRSFAITLSNTDKRAIAKTAELSATMKEITFLRQEIAKSAKRIQYLQAQLD